MMELGIIGFWHSGKTTVFNVLCKGRAETFRHTEDGSRVHLATVKIRDHRAEALAEKFQPPKTTLATTRIIDVDAPPSTLEEADTSHHTSILESQLRHLATADVWLAVVRGFSAQDLPPPDVRKEMTNIVLELILSDLSKIENRLPRLEKTLKKVAGKEKEQLLLEKKVLLSAKEVLEEQRPLTELSLTEEEEKLLRGFQFASQKPILFIINTADDDPHASENLCQQLKEEFNSPSYDVISVNAEIEKEILELPPEEQEEFLQDYKIEVPASERIIQRILKLLKMNVFYTINQNELHVWLIKENSSALEAAGMVHSDFARGFIRAEVLNWQELIKADGFASARREGIVRAEGKSYSVQDGDVINFLFSV
ncbi:DUF933 domain-containing protein [Candidatus Sumerlaeota bacterium]|nr:DUF933 domain-containing protein [Candidatus Sumerlaeota bacterium]